MPRRGFEVQFTPGDGARSRIIVTLLRVRMVI